MRMIPPTRRPVFLVLNQKPCRPRPWEHDDLGAHPRASATHSPSGCHQSTWSSTETWLLVRVSASGSTSWASSPSTTALPYPPTPDPITANRSCRWVPDPRHDKAPQRLAGVRGARHHRNRTRDQQVSRRSVITIASSPPAEQVPNVEISARRMFPGSAIEDYGVHHDIVRYIAKGDRHGRSDRADRKGHGVSCCRYEAPSVGGANRRSRGTDGRQSGGRHSGCRTDPCAARAMALGARAPRADTDVRPSFGSRDRPTAASTQHVETPKGLASLDRNPRGPSALILAAHLVLAEGLSAGPALEGRSPLGGLPTPERLLMGAPTVTARHVLDGCGGCT